MSVAVAQLTTQQICMDQKHPSQTIHAENSAIA